MPSVAGFTDDVLKIAVPGQGLLALLLALARRPELIILDEPSEGLDPVAIEELLQTLQAVRGPANAS
jgi:energy-coupling factor transporter ATP-binding protein EcfA2